MNELDTYMNKSGIRQRMCRFAPDGGTCGPHVHFEIASSTQGGVLTNRINPGYHVYYKNEEEMTNEEKEIQQKRVRACMKEAARFETINTGYRHFLDDRLNGRAYTDYFHKPQKPVNEKRISALKEETRTQTSLRDAAYNRFDDKHVTYEKIIEQRESSNKFMESPGFTRIMFGLNVINILNAGYTLINEYGSGRKEDNEQAWETWLNGFAAIVQFSSSYYALPTNAEANRETALRVARQMDTQLAKLGITKNVNVFTRLAERGLTASVALGMVGNLTFSVLTIVQGVYQYWHNNPKAGTLNIISGIAGGLNVIFTVAAYSTASAALTLAVVNIVLFVVFVAAFILAVLFTLDFIQSFLTCIVFHVKKTPAGRFHAADFRSFLYEHRKEKGFADIYCREEMNSRKKEIPMSDLCNMRSWLINLATDFSGSCLFPQTDFTVFPYDGQQYSYPNRIEYTFRFFYFPPGASLEICFKLYPQGLDYGDAFYVVSPDEVNGSVTEHEEGGFQMHYTFRGIERLMESLRGERKLHIDACRYILYVRIAGDNMCWPCSDDNRIRYIAFSETLIGKHPRNAMSIYNRQYHEAQTGKRLGFDISDKSVLLGTEPEIYRQIKPLILR